MESLPDFNVFGMQPIGIWTCFLAWPLHIHMNMSLVANMDQDKKSVE